MISAFNVRKSFTTPTGVVNALDGANIAVPRAGFAVLMGVSGSGKSTLLNVLSAQSTADSGKVSVNDENLMGLDETGRARFRRTTAALVHQELNLLSMLSAAENVELPIRMLGADRSTARRAALEALDSVGLGHVGDRFPAELSGGQRQRVAIARAVGASKPVLFADEPSGALDKATATQVRDQMADLCGNQGITVVVATHDPLFLEVATVVYHIEDGVVTSVTT